MFTGLVEALGEIVSLEAMGEQGRLEISIPFVGELALGDSVAVNGCCLTVAGLSESAVKFDVLAQTLRVTSLGELSAESVVNLERALRVGDRLGGHFVQGHVDAVGAIVSLEENGQDHVVEVSLPPEIHKLCVGKGSIAIDGISLTIAELKEGSAVFWITPHTFSHTNLRDAKVGDAVNLEADMLAKHVAALMGK
ncbi:MAG: riboflavin synthase [Akkermansiaceae bacterium]|jgi:riboflavin synthase|nr:riboflavin synthase [Akkermansiaceae bacterium]MDP4722321.1 riboflavin synthase [Akkermansiaceae bacterium]MDP4780361.1 riboflavin synthase [Akkermansiaceae bacterium]MDP4846156.1 riboflavin synthase [Akkermansiaceae bacterium]MDP4898653.1 riboflavin synthase [Akkermansiaceae bacterium]